MGPTHQEDDRLIKKPRHKGSPLPMDCKQKEDTRSELNDKGQEESALQAPSSRVLFSWGLPRASTTSEMSRGLSWRAKQGMQVCKTVLPCAVLPGTGVQEEHCEVEMYSFAGEPRKCRCTALPGIGPHTG